MSPALRAVISRMTPKERLELLDDVWALVRDDALPLPASHADEFRARLAKAEAGGMPGDSWEEVRERLRGHA